MTEIPSASRSNTKIIAVVVVIVAFIAGLLVGLAGDRLYLFHTRQFFPRRQFATTRIVDHLDHSLHLTSQQKVEVQGIVERHRQRMELIMSGIRPQMRQEIEAANGEINSVLTPQQRTDFAKLRMRMGPHRGLGPPHGPR